MSDTNNIVSIKELVFKLIVYSSEESKRFFLPLRELAEADSLEEAFFINQYQFISVNHAGDYEQERRELIAQNKFLKLLISTEKQFMGDLADPLNDFSLGTSHSILEFVHIADDENSDENESIGVTKNSGYEWAKMTYGVEINPWKDSRETIAKRTITAISGVEKTVIEHSTSLDVSAVDQTIQLLSKVKDSIRAGTLAASSSQAVSTSDVTGEPTPHAGSNVNTDTLDGKQAFMAVTLFFVAKGLANRLEASQWSEAEELKKYEAFKDNNQNINTDSIANYIADQYLGTDSNLHISDNQQITPLDKTGIILYLLTSQLAVLLKTAIENGDFIAFQNEKKEILETYIKGNGNYNSIAMQRYITSHVIGNSKFPNQGSTAIQKRLGTVQDNITGQDISQVSISDIENCLQIVIQQHKTARDFAAQNT